MASTRKPLPDSWAEADRAWRAAADYQQPPRHPAGGAEPERTGRRPARPGGLAGSLGEAGPYLGLGLQIAASMALFVGGGVLVDGWLGSGPWGTIAGAALGLVGVVGLVVKLAATAPSAKKGRRAGASAETGRRPR